MPKNAKRLSGNIVLHIHRDDHSYDLELIRTKQLSDRIGLALFYRQCAKRRAIG